MISPRVDPWPFREGDIPPGEDAAKVRAALARFQLEEVRTEAAFALGYATLDAQFGPAGEMERPEVLTRWFREGSLSPPDARIPVHYHMSMVWEGATLAAVRDHFSAVDRASGRCVAFLSHCLVLPPFRRSGVAALLRALPAAHLRRDATTLGVEAREVTLVSEMEPLEPDRDETLVRLYSYGRGGFRVVPPWHLPYAQCDFRDVVGLGVEARPVPMMLLVRQVGEESSASLQRRRADALLDHVAAVHEHTVDVAQRSAIRRNIARRLDPRGAPIPLIVPTPAEPSLTRLRRAALHDLYPATWLGDIVVTAVP